MKSKERIRGEWGDIPLADVKGGRCREAEQRKEAATN